MPRFSAAVAALFASISLSHAQNIDRERLARIDEVAMAAIQRGDCPGVVAIVVHDDAVVYRKSFGLRSKAPDVRLEPDAIFDLASLTKSVATASGIMQLIEQGKLRPSDKVAKHWPEFAANGKADVTIEQCLLHTSGLIADNSIADYKDGRAKAIENVAALPLEAQPGARFKYSDVGYIVLGILVERISGQPLDEYASAHLFAPLKMTSTMYKPKPELHVRVAPSGLRDGKIITGEVHDPRAFAMDGVAGHAGLFGSADDLARFSRMLLRDGELDGVRLFSPLGVKMLTEARTVPGGLRSRGWDVDTGFTAQRGDLFPAGDGFGHTGFTGTSLWIDPPSKTAIILLTSRLYPNEKGNATELRRQVGTIVAGAITSPRPRSVPKPQAAVNVPISKPVLTGIDVLRRDAFAKLKGRNVGIVTNHTGRASDGETTIDLLVKAEGVKVVALFSPEHGIRGEKDEKVGDGKDEKTGLPIFSLYGERRKPSVESLKGIDTLVYDIQDIGCRFYTYGSTLSLILETAKEQNLSVVVLDRPNPIGGISIEGPVLDSGRETFVGFHTIPLRHGMTVGELAGMMNVERKIVAKLEIIRCENWHRADTFDRTGLTWRNPSPNMRHLTAAILYPGIGILEVTNVSVGRGTERPFEWIGAPWLDARKLAATLNAAALPGVRFLPVVRTPTSSVHVGKLCNGVDILIDDWATVRPVRIGLEIATALRKQHKLDWDTKRFDTLLIHKPTHDGLLAGKPVAELERAWQPGLTEFTPRRRAFLLYPE